MRPREAAVMPLPSEEVTPPVTNTNLGTGWTSGVFLILRLRDGEGKTVANDESGSIRSGVRRVGGNLDRLIAATILEVSIESQSAETGVAKLTALHVRVLDDRDQSRAQESKAIAQRDRGGERRRVGREPSRRHIEPTAEIGRHVRISGEADRTVLTAETAEQRARAAALVDDEGAHDHVGARRHVALEPVGRARARDVATVAPLGDDAFEAVLGDDLEERFAVVIEMLRHRENP